MPMLMSMHCLENQSNVMPMQMLKFIYNTNAMHWVKFIALAKPDY